MKKMLQAQELKIKEIVAKILKINLDNICNETGPLNTAEWDSFCHMQILSEIENHFEIEFDPNVIPNIIAIKDIILHVNNLLLEKSP